jgi:hypothetical protein
MRQQKPKMTGEGDLFRARLDQIVNMKHELVQLGGKIDWDWIDREIAPFYSDKGRPGIETYPNLERRPRSSLSCDEPSSISKPASNKKNNAPLTSWPDSSKNVGTISS